MLFQILQVLTNIFHIRMTYNEIGQSYIGMRIEAIESKQSLGI